jgi:hypothetical protein
MPNADTTLGEQSEHEYGNWHSRAAINKDRG